MLTNNLLVLKKYSLGLAIGWTLLIAVLCLVKFGSLPSFSVSSADKYIHIILHFGFTLFWGFYFSQKQNQIALPTIINIVILSVLYGILVEVLQETFTTTRHADIFDVLANLVGALIALGVFTFIKKTKSN
jgi:VanZ family protein